MRAAVDDDDEEQLLGSRVDCAVTRVGGANEVMVQVMPVTRAAGDSKKAPKKPKPEPVLIDVTTLQSGQTVECAVGSSARLGSALSVLLKGIKGHYHARLPLSETIPVPKKAADFDAEAVQYVVLSATRFPCPCAGLCRVRREL